MGLGAVTVGAWLMAGLLGPVAIVNLRGGACPTGMDGLVAARAPGLNAAVGGPAAQQCEPASVSVPGVVVDLRGLGAHGAGGERGPVFS